MTDPTYEERRSHKALILGVLLVMAFIAGMVLVVSAPANRLLGDSVYGVRSAFHGLMAGVLMITMTVGFYQGFRLWAGERVNTGELEIGSVLNAAVCFLTILFGNWLYIPYRAKGGPRTYFLDTNPDIHKIFFEFKEFTALFTLPLAVGAAYLICRYGRRVESDRVLRECAAILLVMAFFYFLVAFGLGAAVTKLKPV
ncbi:MAG: hypothetical protein HYZ52_03580 [Candidatus Omnitrophica bacterium]|nr:hypothetical protein [Candidatus Omnitrophota bacterium]